MNTYVKCYGWNKDSNSIKKELDSNHIYNKQFLRAKVEF